MRDIRVSSWIELVETLHDIPQTSHGRYRSDFVYGGLADESWGLETSLMRMGSEYEKLEGPLLRSFRKYAEPGSLPPGTIWTLLAVAQHHGLPTRLLDWTVSPKVAVHFATAEEEHYDKDGVIWCVNVPESRSLLPQLLFDILSKEYAFLFSVEMLDENIATLSKFDSLAGKEGFVLFFEPPSLDSRIVNQWGIMSVMPGSSLVLGHLLRDHPSMYHRVIIPREIKRQIRDMLDQDNVTERMLFPGLDGLSRWLKRYYGPGPTRTR